MTTTKDIYSSSYGQNVIAMFLGNSLYTVSVDKLQWPAIRIFSLLLMLSVFFVIVVDVFVVVVAVAVVVVVDASATAATTTSVSLFAAHADAVVLTFLYY